MTYSCRNLVAVVSCSGLALLSSGCKHQSTSDATAAGEVAIREADARWSKAAEANDLNGTMAFYTEDARLLAPNETLHRDNESRKQSWAALETSAYRVSWKVDYVGMAQSGEMGYVTGTYLLADRITPGKPPIDAGKIVEVWKKQADGTWKCVVDTYNSDMPLPSTGTAAK